MYKRCQATISRKHRDKTEYTMRCAQAGGSDGYCGQHKPGGIKAWREKKERARMYEDIAPLTMITQD